MPRTESVDDNANKANTNVKSALRAVGEQPAKDADIDKLDFAFVLGASRGISAARGDASPRRDMATATRRVARPSTTRCYLEEKCAELFFILAYLFVDCLPIQPPRYDLAAPPPPRSTHAREE